MKMTAGHLLVSQNFNALNLPTNFLSKLSDHNTSKSNSLPRVIRGKCLKTHQKMTFVESESRFSTARTDNRFSITIITVAVITHICQ